MNIDKVLELFNSFLDSKINTFCSSNPLLTLIKPVIKRVVDNNVSKVYSKLSLLADSNGNIDVENILPEMFETLKTMEPYNINTELLGDIVIGKGSIILNIPMTDRVLVIDSNDLNELVTLLTKN